MAKKFIVLTNPINVKTFETAPKEFFQALENFFDEKFNHRNTDMITNPMMSEGKMHIFQDQDYIGWFAVIPEEHYDERKVSTKH